DAIAVLLAERFERDTLAVWATTSELGFELVVGRSIEALIDLIESEPELYAFLVRSIRSGDRGFLDNALVRAINGRAIVVMGFLAPALDTDTIAVLTDGLFGFMFAAVESWLPRRRPSRSRFVAALAAVVSRGIQVAVDQAGAAVPGSRGRERGPERGQGRERERGQGRERGQRRGRLA
ncbi:MAG TPA: hypothetical protein VFA96_09895, partial [Nocardioides sp.]|nr:hypothetical protein [Nocardioides sp.]